MAGFWIERIYPYIVAVVFGGIVYALNWELEDVTNFSNVLNAIVTVSSIIIGFLGTMASVLISLTNSKVMDKIRKKKAEKVLAGYIKISIVAGLLLALYSLALNLFENYTGKGSDWMLIALVVLTSFFLLSSYRIFHVLLNILTSVLMEGASVHLDTKEESSLKKHAYSPK
jgi:chromate transport protein ChrA